MFTPKQLDRYADVLLWGMQTSRGRKFKKNDLVLVRYDRLATPLMEVLWGKLLDRGLHPIPRAGLTWTMEQRFFETANSRQLGYRIPGEAELYAALNGSIFLHAPESLTHLGGIDPAKIGQTALARKYLRDILDQRETQGAFGWTLCMLPTPELARHAGLSMTDYTRQIVRACFLNRRDPLAEWQRVFKNAARIKHWLNRMPVRSYHIESAGIDLTITPGRERRWIGLSGHNIPSFELFISPDWRGTDGVYFADQPSFRSGNRVRGLTLAFRKGVVVSFEAESGREFVRKQLALDKGASRLGEFSLTDRRFSKINTFMANTLFDENYGGKYGNCHVALGSSYADTYAGDPADLTPARKKALGFNDSALHWDIVNTEKKRVTARLKGGTTTVIYENGEFPV